MKQHVLQDHGPLCALYKAHEDGRFRSEGDSPAFSHTIVTEIRDAEKQDASFTVPDDADTGETVHIICRVTDTGTPQLIRYQRVIATVEP